MKKWAKKTGLNISENTYFETLKQYYLKNFEMLKKKTKLLLYKFHYHWLKILRICCPFQFEWH